jgi:hypothetical protein
MLALTWLSTGDAKIGLGRPNGETNTKFANKSATFSFLSILLFFLLPGDHFHGHPQTM